MIPFTAQPHSCNRTEEQQLGCEDRNRWLGLRWKRLGISHASIFTQADAPSNGDPKDSSGLRISARTKSARQLTFSVFLPHDKLTHLWSSSSRSRESQDSLSSTAFCPPQLPQTRDTCPVRHSLSSVPVLQIQQFYYPDVTSS